jgi:hypothetical protein
MASEASVLSQQQLLEQRLDLILGEMQVNGHEEFLGRVVNLEDTEKERKGLPTKVTLITAHLPKIVKTAVANTSNAVQVLSNTDKSPITELQDGSLIIIERPQAVVNGSIGALITIMRGRTLLSFYGDSLLKFQGRPDEEGNDESAAVSLTNELLNATSLCMSSHAVIDNVK